MAKFGGTDSGLQGLVRPVRFGRLEGARADVNNRPAEGDREEREMSSKIVRRYFLPIVCVFTSAALAPSYAGPSPSGSGPAWASLAPVPSVGGPGVGGVEGMSVAQLGDKIVAALGFDNFSGD